MKKFSPKSKMPSISPPASPPASPTISLPSPPPAQQLNPFPLRTRNRRQRSMAESWTQTGISDLSLSTSWTEPISFTSVPFHFPSPMDVDEPDFEFTYGDVPRILFFEGDDQSATNSSSLSSFTPRSDRPLTSQQIKDKANYYSDHIELLQRLDMNADDTAESLGYRRLILHFSLMRRNLFVEKNENYTIFKTPRFHLQWNWNESQYKQNATRFYYKKEILMETDTGFLPLFPMIDSFEYQ